MEGLYRRFAATLTRKIRGRFPTAPVEVIEDACAHAWAELAKHPDVQTDPRVEGWLVVAAWHHAIRDYPRAAPIIDGYDATSDQSVEDIVEAREALRAIARLRPRRRRVFERHVAGLSHAEIQEELGCSFTAVNRHVTESRAELRAVR